MVDAALSAFDKGETLTLPSVADADLIDRYEAARGALRQFGKGRHQHVDITISLINTPLLQGIGPNCLKVTLRRRGKTKFSHEGPSSAA